MSWLVELKIFFDPIYKSTVLIGKKKKILPTHNHSTSLICTFWIPSFSSSLASSQHKREYPITKQERSISKDETMTNFNKKSFLLLDKSRSTFVSFLFIIISRFYIFFPAFLSSLHYHDAV